MFEGGHGTFQDLSGCFLILLFMWVLYREYEPLTWEAVVDMSTFFPWASTEKKWKTYDESRSCSAGKNHGFAVGYPWMISRKTQKNTEIYVQQKLVGGWATPLKNMSSSIGMMTATQYMGKCQKWQPNHQPEKFFVIAYPDRSLKQCITLKTLRTSHTTYKDLSYIKLPFTSWLGQKKLLVISHFSLSPWNRGHATCTCWWLPINALPLCLSPSSPTPMVFQMPKSHVD